MINVSEVSRTFRRKLWRFSVLENCDNKKWFSRKVLVNHSKELSSEWFVSVSTNVIPFCLVCFFASSSKKSCTMCSTNWGRRKISYFSFVVLDSRSFFFQYFSNFSIFKAESFLMLFSCKIVEQHLFQELSLGKL